MTHAELMAENDARHKLWMASAAKARRNIWIAIAFSAAALAFNLCLLVSKLVSA